MPANDFADDDQHKGRMPKLGTVDRPVHQGVAGIGRVHAHHMLHEQKIGLVVADIAERCQQTEDREARDHHDLGDTGDVHGVPLPLRTSKLRHGVLEFLRPCDDRGSLDHGARDRAVGPKENGQDEPGHFGIC